MKQLLQEAHAASQAAAAEVDAALAGKLSATRGLRDELAAELDGVQQERGRVVATREQLLKALADKQ